MMQVALARQWKLVAALSAAIALGISPASAAKAPERVVPPAYLPVPADIEAKPADENEETSQAISAILQNVARAYATVDALHVEGTFLKAEKEEEATSYSQADLKLDFRRPNKLAIVTTSNEEEFQKGFYADGTTITMVSYAGKQYFTMAQPDLAAYAANWRQGDIYWDYSGTIAFSGTAALLITEDPMKWIRDNVTRYVYEGTDEVSGRECHRIRFNQENPDSIVLLWVDKESFLVPKISFIDSYTEEFEMAESFEAGTYATMRLANWSKYTTAPESVKDSAFKAKIPKDFKSAEIGTPRSRTRAVLHPAEGSFWERLVKTAAKDSAQETTWSLTRSEGTANLDLQEYVETPEQVADLDVVYDSSGRTLGLTMAYADGTIKSYKADGSESDTLKLPQGIGMYAYMDTPTSGPVLVVSDVKQQQLDAYRPDGTHLWTYKYPYSPIDTIRSGKRPEFSLYVYVLPSGVRRLDPWTGEVLFANSETDDVSSIEVAPPGLDAVALPSQYAFDVHITDKDLRITHTFSPDEQISGVWFDPGNKDAPLVTLGVLNGLALQRRTLAGEVIATTMIESQKDARGMLLGIKLRRNGASERCSLIVERDGRLVVAGNNGEVFYRGQVSANQALIERNGGQIYKYFFIADTDNDGSDELYFPLDKHMMRLVLRGE